MSRRRLAALAAACLPLAWLAVFFGLIVFLPTGSAAVAVLAILWGTATMLYRRQLAAAYQRRSETWLKTQSPNPWLLAIVGLVFVVWGVVSLAR